MNDPDHSDDTIARLLRSAGRRPMPSPDAMQRLYDGTRREWHRAVLARRRVRWFASAAAILFIVAGTVPFWRSGATPPAIVVARVLQGGESLAVIHAAQADSRENDPSLLVAGDRLRTGSGGSQIAQLPGGVLTLRLDRDTEVEWRAQNEVALLRGRLYVDTGRAAPIEAHGGAGTAVGGLVVLAAGARIRHVGTQFTTELEGGRLLVAVRNGLVKISVPARASGPVTDHTVQRGELALVEASSNSAARVRRVPLLTFGERWGWVDDLAPRLAIEGRPLLEILRALAYQAGLELEFASTDIEAQARSTILHGPALDLRPVPALQAVLATTRFEARSTGPDGDSIIIDSR